VTETPAEKTKRRPSLKDVGDWAGSLNSIIALVIVVAGGIAAVVTNHFTGFITGGESGNSAPAKQIATMRLSRLTPTAQDDQSDTYTLVLRFQGYGDRPCAITWQRQDAANSALDPVPHSVRCAGSGQFEQDVRIPVPQLPGGSYTTTFRLVQGTRTFRSATTKEQFIP
jgi:hypothetical protein